MLCPVSRENAEHTCGLLTNSMFASSSRVGARTSPIIRSMRACASRTLEIAHRWTRIVNYSHRAQLFPYRRVPRRTAQLGYAEIVGPFPQIGMQKKASEPEGSEALISVISLMALLCGDAEAASGGTRQHQNASPEASTRYSHSVTNAVRVLSMRAASYRLSADSCAIWANQPLDSRFWE